MPKTLAKLGPNRHYVERRVRSHVLLCVLAYLLAKVIGQRLRHAGIAMNAETMLGQMSRVQAAEYEQAGQRIVPMTEPALRHLNRVRAVEYEQAG